MEYLAYNPNDNLPIHRAAQQQKLMQKYCRTLKFTQNDCIIFEKLCKTQLWRFEKVFEHFIVFTELAAPF